MSLPTGVEIAPKAVMPSMLLGAIEAGSDI